MKNIVSFSLLLFASCIQAQNFEWLQTPGLNLDMNPDMISYNTACDPEGNVYFAGFKDNPYPYTDILGDLYYNKYSSSGALLFSMAITGKAIIHNMISDTDGNIIVALGFVGSVTIDDVTLSADTEGMHYALVKFDNNGNRIWHKKLSILINNVEWVNDLRAITTDSDNNIYVGYSDYTACRITKYSPAGTELLTILQSNIARITSVAVDELGNIYAAGACAGDVDATFSGTVAASALLYDTYLVKYSASGTYQWAKFVEDVTCPEPHVAVHSSNEIYFSSSLHGPFAFDDMTAEGPVQSGGDFFLAKVNGNGQYQWVRELPGMGGAGPGRGNFLATDPVGNIYFAGYTQGNVNWEGNVQTTGGRKSVLLRYSPSGTVLAAATAGGNGRADAVAINQDGDAFIAGMGSGNGTFGAISYEGSDAYYTYLAKISFDILGAESRDTDTPVIYPNPAQDVLYISGAGNSRVTIINTLGQIIAEFENSSQPLDISALAAGSYFVRPDGFKAVKLIKN